MSVIKNIKNVFGDIIKEHPFSIISFFIAMVLRALFLTSYYEDTPNLEYFNLISIILIGYALGALLCESIHSYRKDQDGYVLKKPSTIISYCLITVVSSVCYIPNWLINNTSTFESLLGDAAMAYYDFFNLISAFVFVTVAILILFFFYKKSKETFEVYAAKACCGLFKSGVVFVIVTLGTFLVYWAFDVLLLHSEDYSYTLKILYILYGLVGFPSVIAGLTKIDGPTVKFAKIILGYVLPGLTAIGLLIVYIYSFKILFTWTFPANEVFEVVSTLFCLGCVALTLAQGCMDENMQKPLRILNFLFAPLIILQILSLSLRIYDYGFTVNRYAGLVLIVFEVIYFVIYTIRIRRDKDILSKICFVAIALMLIMFFVPGINMHSTVTLSQSAKINHFLKIKDQAKDVDKQLAYNAYVEIKNEGGISGYNYLHEKLSQEDYELVDSLYVFSPDYDYDIDEDYSLDEDPDNYFYFSVEVQRPDGLDISEFGSLYVPNDVYCGFDVDFLTDEKNRIDSVFILEDKENYGYINIADQIDEIIALNKKLDKIPKEEYDEKPAEDIRAKQSALLTEPIELSDGGKLIIVSIDFEGQYTSDDPGYNMSSIYIRGFLVK